MDSLSYKKIKFSEKVSQSDMNLADEDLNNYYQTLGKMNLIYTGLRPFLSEEFSQTLKTNTVGLLSTNTILAHVRQLLSNQFLFDMTKYNRTTHNWELVDYKDLNSNINQNTKSEILLKDALRLVNHAILQHSVVDGAILSDRELTAFSSVKNLDCQKDIKQVACLANTNEPLALNLIRATFSTLVTARYYQAWNKLTPNNPDYLNDKLANSPVRVVWVGKGASPLFTGEIINNNSYADGAYIKILLNEKLFKLPELATLNSKASFKSAKLNLLIEYKNAIEKELVERKLNKILTNDELIFYNQEKKEQLGV